MIMNKEDQINEFLHDIRFGKHCEHAYVYEKYNNGECTGRYIVPENHPKLKKITKLYEKAGIKLIEVIICYLVKH